MRILKTCWLLLAVWLLPFSLRGANYVFVFNSAGTTATVYDADSMTQVATPLVGLGAAKAFGVPDLNNQGKFLKFYVVTTSSVVVLNPDFTVKANQAFLGTLSSAPNAAALTGDAKWLLVVAGTQINILNTANDTFISPSLITTNTPLGVTVTPDSKTAYVLESSTSRIDSIIFTVTPPALSGSINVPSGAVTALGMAPNGSRLYAGTNSQLIYDIDRNNNLPATAIFDPCGGGPTSISFDPDPTVGTAVLNCGSVAPILNLPTRTASANSFVNSGLAGAFFSKVVLPGANKAFLLSGGHIYYGPESAGGVPPQVNNPQTGTPFGSIAADMDSNPDGSALFAAFADSTPKLVKISTSSFVGLATATLSQAPTGVSVIYVPALQASFLEIYGGNNQTGPSSQIFPSSLAVRARNGSTPAFGTTVAFSTTTPGVGFTESPITTNLSGVAETLFNVPVTTAVQVTATVTAGGSAAPVTFTINPGSNPNTQALTKVSGDNQLVVQNTSFSFNLVVKGSTNVTLSIGTGTSPVLCPSSTVTDPVTGVGTFACSANALPPPGNAAVGYTITVVDPAGNSVQFAATIVPDATFLPASVSVSVNPTVGLAGQAGTVQVQALLANAGTPPSVGVMFTSSQRDLVFATPNAVLAGGVATSAITFGCSVGTGSITAQLQSAGVSVGTAGFVTVAGPVAQLVKVQGDGQSGNVGQTLNTGLVVTVADSCGNPIPQQPVTWTVSPFNAATLRTLIGSTDNSGHAAVLVTLGTRSGSFTVTATSGSFSATFTLTVNVNPTKLLVTSGSG
ncbi:MAG TPA: Ig-like domain-containing protein, partial [Bryobacterales bacterium]|nr:Ig-like domain-containing protein [Bryobacterales bacterium]